MAAPGLVVVYEFPYRGAAEEYSQRYHLDDDFSDEADFIATADAFVTAWKPTSTNVVKINRIYGYHDTDDDAAYVQLYTSSNVGTLSAGVSIPTPGDDAVWVRWDTERTNSRGKRVYLRKYFHPALTTGPPNQDVAWTTQRTALETFANNATSTGWNGKHLAGPDGLVPGGGVASSTYITTRTLKRR
jgi:hypothetical protein